MKPLEDMGRYKTVVIESSVGHTLWARSFRKADSGHVTVCFQSCLTSAMSLDELQRFARRTGIG